MEIVVVTPTELGGIRSAPLENSPKTSSGVSEEAPVSVVRINKVHAGGAFGEADFLLGRTHRYHKLLSLFHDFVM